MSALAKHAWNCNHPIDWTNTRVLFTHQDDYTRIVQEAISITTHNTLNRDGGALPTKYNSLLQKQFFFTGVQSNCPSPLYGGLGSDSAFFGIDSNS